MGEEQQQAPVAATPASSSGGKDGGKKIALIIIVLLIVLAGGYVAYAKFVKKASSVSEVLSPASLKLNPNCKYNDPDLCKFMNNWKEVDSLTMTSESTISGKATKTVLKMKGKDKTQMITEEAGKESYNVISIGNTTYTKDYTDNKWFKYTSEPTAIKDADIDFDVKEESAVDKTTYKKIGTEACGKFTCFKYQVIDPDATDSTEYIYFDNKEYKLRKTRSEGKDGSVNEATYEYSSVSVSEPSPVKEGNPYSLPASSLPAATTAPSTSSSESAQTPDYSSYSAPAEDTTPPETSLDVTEDTSGVE